MSNTPLEQIVAEGAAAEAAARARDAQDAAIAEAAVNGSQTGDHFAEPTGTTTVTDPAAGPTLTPGQRDLTVPERAPEQPGVRDDDFGLNGNLADVLADALDKKFNPDTAATPGPGTDPGEATPESSAEEGAGAGGAADDAAAAPSAPPAPAPDFSLDDYARDYFGTNLDREQAAHLFAVLNNLQTASPEQRQQIDAILAGRAAPAFPPAHPTPAPTEGAAPAAPAAPALTPEQLGLPPRPGDHDPEGQHVYDTLIAPTAQALVARQAQLEQEIARTTAQQQQQVAQAQAARVDAAVSAWRNERPVLSDGEFDALQAKVVRSGIFMPLVNSFHGNVEQAVSAAFDQMFWSDPALRDRALANAASGRDPITGAVDPNNLQAQAASQVAEGRKQLAASVSGGGGSTVSRTPPAPRTQAERKSAMIGEIAAAMQGGE